MSSLMPAYVLIYPGSFHPTLDGFAATFIRGKIKNKDILITVCWWFSHKRKKPVIKRDDNTTIGGMSFSFGLFKLQQLIGIVYVPVSKVFHITEAQATIQAKDKRTPYVGVLVVIMARNQPLDFFRRKHVLA